jgi:quinol monooxygenase YgiN
MSRVMSLVTFSIDRRNRDEFLRRAAEELKPYWESRGSERYEVYEEMGPTGPTGRFVEVNLLKDRDAYHQMTQHVRTANDLPARAYALVQSPQFQVMEVRV